jgi:arylsulfatase A-like enzyme
MRTPRWLRPAIAPAAVTAAAALLAHVIVATQLAAQSSPQLVVVIIVDQLRGDYLDRFGANLSGGLLRFRDAGTYYPAGQQDHANTATAPGYSTVLSGRVPASTNILSNSYGVPDPMRPLVAGARGAGASPWRFRGSTLYDWMRVATGETRMLSVSQKDRGAILSVGTARTNVFWWVEDRFTTSTYYRDTLPTWVARWNQALDPAAWQDRAWTLLLPESAYPEPDDQPWEGVASRRGSVFPHVQSSMASMKAFPWMDSLTLDLALHGVRELQLGRRGTPDLLAVGLSTLDEVGHNFGPNSREVHDMVVRVDRWLAAFMAELEREVPAQQIVYVLTGDHGITTMPEFLRAHGEEDAGTVNLGAAMRRIVAPLQERYEQRLGFEIQYGLVLADTVALRVRSIDVDALADDLSRAFAALPGVARTWTPRTLAAADPGDESARVWRNAIPPSYGWLAAAHPREGWVLSTSVQAHHGPATAENRSVPIAFVGAGIPAVRVERVARTVDIAPTLAALLGIRPTEAVDGTVLPEVLPAWEN